MITQSHIKNPHLLRESFGRDGNKQKPIKIQMKEEISESMANIQKP